MKLLVITMLVAGALARPDVSHLTKTAVGDDRNAQIISQELDQSPDWKYYWSFENNNGIKAHEHGEQKGEEGTYVGGVAGHVAPDGQLYEVKYTADQYGYHPEGSHLPTSPPIPDYIVRSLEYIRAHPPPPERR